MACLPDALRRTVPRAGLGSNEDVFEYEPIDNPAERGIINQSIHLVPMKSRVFALHATTPHRDHRGTPDVLGGARRQRAEQWSRGAVRPTERDREPNNIHEVEHRN